MEEKHYDLVEILAVDGGDVSETSRAYWIDGARVVARADGVTLHLVAVDDDAGVILETEP